MHATYPPSGTLRGFDRLAASWPHTRTVEVLPQFFVLARSAAELRLRGCGLRFSGQRLHSRLVALGDLVQRDATERRLKTLPYRRGFIRNRSRVAVILHCHAAFT